MAPGNLACLTELILRMSLVDHFVHCWTRYMVVSTLPFVRLYHYILKKSSLYLYRPGRAFQFLQLRLCPCRPNNKSTFWKTIECMRISQKFWDFVVEFKIFVRIFEFSSTWSKVSISRSSCGSEPCARDEKVGSVMGTISVAVHALELNVRKTKLRKMTKIWWNGWNFAWNS